jgi:hypothetical protein
MLITGAGIPQDIYKKLVDLGITVTIAETE